MSYKKCVNFIVQLCYKTLNFIDLYVTESHLALIDRDTFEKVQARLAAIAEKTLEGPNVRRVNSPV